MSTKCQYKPIISTGVYHSALKRLREAITIKRGEQSHANDHVQSVQSGHREIEKKQNLGLMKVLRIRILEPGPGI